MSSTVLLMEARPFRPFKSSEEYLYAMKEDLAEWFQTLYPHLGINVDNFMDRLETGVALCEHANAVKTQAEEYIQKKQARKIMTRSVTGSLAQAHSLVKIPNVRFFTTAKPGTFFARDNVSNFIKWCRHSLEIIECLLFESDDLIMRKNEKHVILCLLEVARRGAKFGMLAPMLVQMERQIDREIAADQRKLGNGLNEGGEEENGMEEDSDSELEDEQPVLMYGPLPQIVTNDLKSLDEMVRDLVEKCTCPTQFPMIRVSEGKYRIGDTKVLIFVRILRNHVMVRVGGGWDTLSHYLDKHDPCRCRAQHRTTQGARLVNKPGAADLQGAQVYYDRSPPRVSSTQTTNTTTPNKEYLGPPTNTLNRSRSRSPSTFSRRSASPNLTKKQQQPQHHLAPIQNRSRSPTPNFTSTHMTKLTNGTKSPKVVNSGPQSLPYIPVSTTNLSSPVKNGRSPPEGKVLKSEASLQVGENLTDHSDNASEVSDEGYRSLGIVHDKTRNRTSVYSQNSVEDVDENEHHDSLDYEDETNDCGLRRTQFSQRIYEENSLESTPHTNKWTPKSRPITRSNSADVTTVFHHPVKLPPSKENTFIRSSSTERTDSAPKSLPAPKKTARNINNTWNGRQKAARPSIGDVFSMPFSRNSAGRRSVSVSNYDSNGRRISNSANTSPTKGRLRQELLKTVKKNDDDLVIAQEVQAILRKFGSLTILNDDLNSGPNSLVDNDNRGGYYSPRKDSRATTQSSRIPAPVTHRA